MLVSHGRGGAGNIANSTKFDKITPKDLQTPVLKSSVVTTGRGGTGNMLKNDDPYETRLRQDVEGAPRRTSSGAAHYGRGGAANIFKASPEEQAAAAKAANLESAIEDDDSSSHKRRRSSAELAAKGKAWLNSITGKKA
ncbi:hypothetical protein ACHAQA_002879 [Verticillium albo-atrum]